MKDYGRKTQVATQTVRMAEKKKNGTSENPIENSETTTNTDTPEEAATTTATTTRKKWVHYLSKTPPD